MIIISNQPDFKNYGFYNLQNHIDNNIREKIPEIDIEYFYGSKKNKKYYKPAPGMVLKYKKIYNLNLNKSYLIGDRWRDIGTAFNAGIKNSMLIYNKDYTENSFFYPPNFIFNNINQALKKIILLEKLKILTTN